MDNELIFAIGGDISNFNTALKQAEASYDRMYKNMRGKRDPFATMGGQFAKTMQNMENTAEIASKKVRAAMAKALGVTNNKANKEMLDRYEAAWVQTTTKVAARRLKAEQLLYKRKLKNAERVAKRQQALSDRVDAYQRRKADVLFKRKMATIRRIEAREKKAALSTASAGGDSKYNLGHAMGITALYGGVAQVMFGIQAAIGATMTKVAEFDKMIYQNMGVLQMNKEEATRLAITVEELGVKYGVAFTEIQGAMITLGRAGVDSSSIEKYTETVLALAQITGDTLTESAEAVAAYREVFKDAAKEIDVFGGKMAYIANETVLSMANFKIMGNYALSAANNMGMTFDSMMSLMGAMSKIGKQSSTIGTTIRRLGTSLKDQSDAIVNAWRKIGFEQEKVAKNMHINSDLTIKAVTRQLAAMNNEKYKEATKELNVLMKDMFDTLRDIGKSGHYEMFSQGYVDAVAQAEEVTSSFDSNVAKLINKFYKLATVIGIDVLDAMNRFITKGGEGELAMGQLSGAFKSFGKWAIKILNAVVMGVGLLISTIALAVSALAGLTGFAGKVIGGLAGGVTKEDYEAATFRKTAIKDELTLLAAGDRKRVALRAERAELSKNIKLYEESTGLVQTLTTGGENLEKGSQKAMKEIINFSARMTKLHVDINEAANGGVDTIGAKLSGNGIDTKRIGTPKGQMEDMAAVIKLSDKALVDQAARIAGEKLLTGEYTKQQYQLENTNRAIERQKDLVSKLEEKAKGTIASEKINETVEKEKLRLVNMQIAQKEQKAGISEKAARKAAADDKKAQRARDKAARKAEADAKRGAAAAKKMQKAKEKASKDAIKDLVLEAKIKHQIATNEMLSKGQAVTKEQELKWAHELAVLKEQEAKATWEQAKAQAVGAEAIYKAKEAYLAYKKASGDTIKSINDQHKELADNIESGLSQAFDMILNGDLQSAFGSMFKSMVSDAAKGSIKVIATAIAQGEAWSLTAIARGAAEGGYPGLIAMAAAMAALGLFGGSVGGGGGLSDSELKAAEGITSFENNAVDDALQGLLENSVKGLEHSAQMVQSLQTLVMMSDRASMSLGDTLSGKEYNPNNKDTLWGGKEFELLSTGIKINPTSISDLSQGILNANSYMIEKVTKSSWFGLSSKESTKTTTGAADTGFMDAYTEAFMSGVDALREASTVLGVTEDQFTQFTASWEMIVQQLNFEGMDAEARAELIRGSLSAQMDSFSSTLVSLSAYVENYKLMGESTSETIIRLANDFETVESHLGSLGMELGAVSNSSIAFSQSLREVFGTMQDFGAFMSWFNNKFFTDEERKTMATQQLQASLALYGETMPATTEGMKQLINMTMLRLQTMAGEVASQKAIVLAAQSNLMVVMETAAIGSAAALGAAERLADAEKILNDMEIAYDQVAGLMQAIRDNMANIDAVFDSAQTIKDAGIAADTERANAAEKASKDAKSAADSCAKAADDAANAAQQLQDGIHSLTLQWMDSLEAAKASYEYAKQESGLVGLTFDNFVKKFEAAVAADQVNNENIGDWESMSSALKSLEDAIKANTKVNEGGISVAEMRKTWGATGQDEAIYKANEKETGLYGLTVDNFLEKFNKAVAGGMTVELFDKWSQMSSALSEARDAEVEWLETQLDFYKDIKDKIDDAYLGSLSYLNSLEKAKYAGDVAQAALESGDSQTYIDKLGEQLEYEKKMSVTKEEYIPIFEEYINELKNAKPEKDINDAVTELEDINKKIDELKDRIEAASYQN